MKTEGGVAERAADWFAECFGAQPDGVWHAPGRVNLIGEHTDYNEGFVLPFALAQGARAAMSRRDDGMLELRSRQVPDAPATVALPGSRRARRPAGPPIRRAPRGPCGRPGYQVAGASVAIDADLERGAALSSSAALECATALALTDLNGLSVPRPELAALARRGENEFVGVPSGIMDESASLLCRAGHALLLDCRSGQTSDVPLDLAAAGLILLVIDTGVRHALADGRYAARRRSCEEAARALGRAVPAGRDRWPGAGRAARRPRAPSPGPACGHRERARPGGRGAAAGGRDRPLRPAAVASHASLRDDFEVSWPEADVAVEAATTGGALGARMTGGGFGGSVIALTETRRGPDVRAGVEAAYDRRGWGAPRFLEALPSPGALRLVGISPT